MSTKDWKNGEINTLLTEKWGFSFNLDKLNEKTGDDETEEKAKKSVEGEGTSKEEEDDLEEGLADAKASPRPRQPHGAGDKCYDDKGDRVECVEEGLADAKASPRPRQPHGAGDKCYDDKGDRVECLEEDAPLTKAGKMDRSDVANKDTSKFGVGSKSATHASAGGSVAAPKGGKMDRSDVANKAGGRWLKEDSGEEEGMHYRDNAMSDEDHIKAIRHHLEALEGDRDYDEGHEDLEEGGSGRKDKVRTQSRDSARDSDDRKRPMQEAELRRYIREALKQVTIVKSKKGR
tara:strand:- start:5 stop:874 length:870 start_codon:yes stop_codon:yes gene_type:complete